MPWQQHVLDVALEYDPDSGLLVYRDVGLSVPRQSGKSTLTLVLMALRCLGPFGSAQHVLYTAQDALSARQKWEEDHVQKLDDSKVFQRGRDYKVRLSNGAERIRFSNSSIWRISSTTDTAGHGKTLDLAVIDEAFSHTDFRVDQSFDAPMITRPEPQLWVVSTAGTSKSIYLNARREAGRSAVERGDSGGSAWFEWSAAEDADTLDPAAWRSCSPALGHTISEAVLEVSVRKMLDMGNEDGARRAYLNLTTEDGDGDAPKLPMGSWEAQVDAQSAIAADAVVGVAMTPDRGSTSIGVAGRRAEGDFHVDHVKTAAGSTWVVDAVLEMFGRFDVVRAVAVDGGGPAGSLVADFERAGLQVIKLGTQAFAQSCGSFVDGANEGRLWHRGQAELGAAVANARTRPLGDLWAWLRANGDESVAALEAVTVALGGAARLVDEPADEATSPIVERGGLFSWD